MDNDLAYREFIKLVGDLIHSGKTDAEAFNEGMKQFNMSLLSDEALKRIKTRLEWHFDKYKSELSWKFQKKDFINIVKAIGGLVLSFAFWKGQLYTLSCFATGFLVVGSLVDTLCPLIFNRVNNKFIKRGRSNLQESITTIDIILDHRKEIKKAVDVEFVEVRENKDKPVVSIKYVKMLLDKILNDKENIPDDIGILIDVEYQELLSVYWQFLNSPYKNQRVLEELAEKLEDLDNRIMKFSRLGKDDVGRIRKF